MSAALPFAPALRPPGAVRERDFAVRCIRCGRCLDACPMGLESMMVALYVEAGRGKETTPFGVMDCFECGSCAFVCPAHRPLVQLIRLAKQAVRSSGAGLRK